MNLSSEPISEFDPLPPSRYRRKRNFVPSLTDNERSEMVENMARRVEPTFDFFLFCLLAGAVLAVGWLLHAPAFFIVGALLAPFMAPVVGLSLSSAIGSYRFFFVSLAGVLVGTVLVSLIGLIAGLASPLLPAYISDTAYQTGLLPWDIVVTYLIGVGLTCFSLIKSEQAPAIPSAIIAFALLTRASAAGYFLGKGDLTACFWQIEVIGILVLIGLVLGMLVFWGFSFRGAATSTLVLSAVWILAAILLGWKVISPAVSHSQSQIKLTASPSPFAVSPSAQKVNSSTATITVMPSQTQIIILPTTPINTSTLTLFVPDETETPIQSSTPSFAQPIPSITRTATAKPTLNIQIGWATIFVGGQQGARLRDKPGFVGKVIMIIDNNTVVKVMSGVQFKDQVYWTQVQTNDGTIGWMVHSVLITATPQPTGTSTPQE
jgi:hypothetical protein